MHLRTSTGVYNACNGNVRGSRTSHEKPDGKRNVIDVGVLVTTGERILVRIGGEVVSL